MDFFFSKILEALSVKIRFHFYSYTSSHFNACKHVYNDIHTVVSEQ